MNALDDPPRQRANVCATMSADFRLVVNAAQTHSNKFAAQSSGDGFSERGFTDARRADKAENWALRVFLQLAYGEVLDNALLDFLEPVMIFVEDLLGLFQIEIVFRRFRPRQRNHPVEIIAQCGGFCRIRMHAL